MPLVRATVSSAYLCAGSTVLSMNSPKDRGTHKVSLSRGMPKDPAYPIDADVLSRCPTPDLGDTCTDFEDDDQHTRSRRSSAASAADTVRRLDELSDDNDTEAPTSVATPVYFGARGKLTRGSGFPTKAATKATFRQRQRYCDHRVRSPRWTDESLTAWRENLGKGLSIADCITLEETNRYSGQSRIPGVPFKQALAGLEARWDKEMAAREARDVHRSSKQEPTLSHCSIVLLVVVFVCTATHWMSNASEVLKIAGTMVLSYMAMVLAREMQEKYAVTPSRECVPKDVSDMRLMSHHGVELLHLRGISLATLRAKPELASSVL